MSWYISLILTCQEQVKSSLQLLGGSESEKISLLPHFALIFIFVFAFRLKLAKVS